ncbi:MAG: STAS domain-containing protein [Candidatus Eremiobacteraeota bacterium]|nr:STAS domain-containing protein [Candidatus Eremiobacteraeota bacterium]
MSLSKGEGRTGYAQSEGNLKGVPDPALSKNRIELHGEYDLSRKEEVGALFRSIAEGPQVIIDLRDVTYIDSSFLSELALLRSRLRSDKIMLVGPSQNVKRILTLVSFEQLFQIVNDETA